MADSEHFQLEWSMLQTSDWSVSDLQLAAELGKTLLERNKELETALRHHQNIVEDQAQEIEYLRKQTAALREVNDSRLRIYEQLEVSIQELETSNHRLATQNASDKKHIASLENQVEKLEARCEEMAVTCEEHERCKQESASDEALQGQIRRTSEGEAQALRDQLSEVRTLSTRQATKLSELQDTIDTVTQENLKLEEQVLALQKKQDEMMVIDQVRQGEICRRCLRAQEDLSTYTGDEDESVIDSLMNDDSYQSLLLREVEHQSEGGGPNPYRTLVEKYEALVRAQQASGPAGILRPHQPADTAGRCMSLQEELAMSGEFTVSSTSSQYHRQEDEDDGHFDVGPTTMVSGDKLGPDFSETETSSSGFSDETMNKSTQTEAHVPPGSYLCSITDGDVCKFSIYREASPIETRFRKTPEYRRLFREIFDVLKKAAEAKDEGESLPLLEDETPLVESMPKVPPVTPCIEEVPATIAAHTSSPSTAASALPPTAPKRDILEHLSAGVGGSSSKRHRSRKHRSVEFAQVAMNGAVGPNSLVVSTKLTRRSKREARRLHNQSDSGRSTPDTANISRQHHHRSQPRNTTPVSTEQQVITPSSASQEVAKLKQLEKSYAEVLRVGRQHVNRK
ncbi:cerebellar degeneration-related protein 2-like isoform X8 [Rhodnius prolixus]|uniref:cerebellar degeneration-related protein 2-like isoform X8 n=1 Tax=Rhodnius prolixus TaxID=13249 RepID=UPI003D188A73